MGPQVYVAKLTDVALRTDEPLEPFFLLTLILNLDIPGESYVFKNHRHSTDVPERSRVFDIRVGCGIGLGILVEGSIGIIWQL